MMNQGEPSPKPMFEDSELEVNCLYRLRDGEQWYRGVYVHFSRSNNQHLVFRELDLAPVLCDEVKPALVKKSRWVNVYRSSHRRDMYYVGPETFATKFDAERSSLGNFVIAVEIEWEE